MKKTLLPLGRESEYPNKYDNSVLFAIARSESRSAFITGELPFVGIDIWNAWELTWLGPGAMPVVATLEIRIPATTPLLIESKSLKLYLNSFAMSQFENADVVAETIATDLSQCAKGEVGVNMQTPADFVGNSFCSPPGTCIDSTTVNAPDWVVDEAILTADKNDIVDILRHCEPQQLSLYARYQRRGGIDINPYRSNFADEPSNQRLWRQ